jgi:hypothetical protein
VPATTWDTIRKVNQTLSGGSLITTSTGAGGVAVSRLAQGNIYCELTPTTITGTPEVGFWTSNGLQSTALSNALSSIGYRGSGAVLVNNVTVTTIATWIANNRIDMALNPAAHLVWFRVAGGNWNNSGTADPATNTGGIDYSANITIMSTIAVGVYASASGTVWSAALSAASWAGAAPSGYSSLDNIQYTVVNNIAQTFELNPTVAKEFGPVARAMPMPGDRYQRAYNGTTITVVSGTTKESGSLIAGKKVELYDRLTGELIGSTVSDGSGNWSMMALGRPAVRIVGSDPTTYNSVVYDNVVPV